MTRTASIAALVLLAGCGGSSSPSAATPTHHTPGPLADTWAWDGGAWHQTANTGPAPRYSASLAYDAARGVYIMFGGQTARATSDETWSWDGKTWKELSPAHKPPPRRAAAMAYDPVHRVVVLYGGVVPDAAEGFDASDTWTWDGSDWTVAVEKSTDPGPREGPLMVTAGNGVLLFGGRYYNVKYYGDAWTWDGKTWSRVDRAPEPPGRASSALVWDPVNSSLLVFGGTGLNATAGPGAQGALLGDFWSLAGSAWKQITAAGPPAQGFTNAIWDSGRKRAVVLLGMPCPQPSGDEWAWDGAAWSKTASGISPRWGAASAQNPDGSALIFGGSDEAGC